MATEEKRKELAHMSRELVHMPINRDELLMVVGWVQAHRPPGDWEPGFISNFIGIANRTALGNE